MKGIQLLGANWPAPAAIRTVVTTRWGGASKPPYDSLNLAMHVGDDPARVNANREHVMAHAQLPAPPCWLTQTHSADVVNLAQYTGLIEADASFTFQPNQVCVVLTADCLPILLAGKKGEVVAAIHAGWRGLLGGIIERTVSAMSLPGECLMASLGPAIGPRAFRVGPEVRNYFIESDPAAKTAFVKEAGSDHFMADIYGLARIRLRRAGVDDVSGGEHCTVSETDFYSYRRDHVTGRFASMIWMEG